MAFLDRCGAYWPGEAQSGMFGGVMAHEGSEVLIILNDLRAALR